MSVSRDELKSSSNNLVDMLLFLSGRKWFWAMQDDSPIPSVQGNANVKENFDREKIL